MMKRSNFLLLILCLTLSICRVNAHSGKARFHAVIDTDGAADDLRAICMILGNKEIETLAVTTTTGALTASRAAVKVKALLHGFYHEGIPVAAGQDHQVKPPAWRSQSEKIDWGNEAGITLPEQQAVELMIETINDEDEPVVVICLGSLTNIGNALKKEPGLKEQLDRIVWYSEWNKNKPAGSNYDADKKSADYVLSLGIPVEIISGKESHFTIDPQYVDMVSGVKNNIYAGRIANSLRSGILAPVVASGHMKSWDDLVIEWLLMPELFSSAKINPSVTVHTLKDINAVDAKNAVVQILAGKPDSENRVFYRFPEDPELFAADIAPMISDIIYRHGYSEWRAGVLTNELHGHLGIYAIIGVKMGLRAREYFNIGVDDISIISYAGSNPPVSCLNDGLQVSTGGTLGHGLITISKDDAVRPEAVFTFKGKTIRLKLKKNYSDQIRQDVKDGIALYGNLTENYWLHIRALAIRYWHDFDRHEIFEMTME